MTERHDLSAIAGQILDHLHSRPDVAHAEPFDSAVLARKADGTEYVFYVEHVLAESAASPGREIAEIIAEIADVVLGRR